MSSRFVSGLTTFLFGYDVFVSYSYKDGKGYAAALEDSLGKLDFSCFLDRKELPYGGELTTSLRRAIRRSKAVILVGTETAPQAHYVKVELAEVLANGRTKLIPIDVDGIRERLDDVDVRNLIWINEDAAAARTRMPSVA